jgi:hypothetical protein
MAPSDILLERDKVYPISKDQMSSHGSLVTSSLINIVILIILPVIISLLVFLGVRFPEEGIPSIMAAFSLLGYVLFVVIRYIAMFDEPEKLFLNSEEYFKKFKDEDVVSEYQFVRKLVYPAIAISLSVIIIQQFEFYPFHRDSDLNDKIAIIGVLAFFPLLASIPRLALYLQKDFDYYLAKAYFNIGSGKKDELEKFRYLILMLNAFNKFLKKKLKLTIDDLQIQSLIIYAREEGKKTITRSIKDALEKTDKLELVRQLADLPGLPNKEELLVKESSVLNPQFKEVLTTVIPVIISIIGASVGIIGLFRP